MQHARKLSRSGVRACAYAYNHARAYTHTHTLSHTHHARTYTHARTHTHTHTYTCGLTRARPACTRTRACA
jgi:hypothetical protein